MCAPPDTSVIATVVVVVRSGIKRNFRLHLMILNMKPKGWRWKGCYNRTIVLFYYIGGDDMVTPESGCSTKCGFQTYSIRITLKCLAKMQTLGSTQNYEIRSAGWGLEICIL